MSRALPWRAALAIGVAAVTAYCPAAWAADRASSGPAPVADPPAEENSEIVVTGRGERRIGRDQSASAGAISGEDIQLRPRLRTSERAEAVPGLIAVQHSGGGKAVQYYIRGYNLDHGIDFSISLDGVPMNLPKPTTLSASRSGARA